MNNRINEIIMIIVVIIVIIVIIVVTITVIIIIIIRNNNNSNLPDREGDLLSHGYCSVAFRFLRSSACVLL